MFSNFIVPKPPVDMIMPSMWQTFFLVATSITLLLMSLYCLWILWRDHDSVPILTVFGGVIAAGTIEHIIGPAGLLWYPSIGQNSLIEFAGRSYPVFIFTGNGFWYGPAMILLGGLLVKAKSKLHIWMIFGGIALFDLGMEAFGSWTGVFRYYGDQGIRLFGFPLWWDFQNGALTLLIAWIIVQLRHSYLKGWRSLFIIPMIPCLAMAGNGFEGLYAWLAINSNIPRLVLPGTLASVGMALITVDLVASQYGKKEGSKRDTVTASTCSRDTQKAETGVLR